MDRRIFLALAPLVAMFTRGALAGTAEPAAAPAAASPAAKTPLFAEDAQFWFETQRAFGAAEYGGSLFGEVLVPGEVMRLMMMGFAMVLTMLIRPAGLWPAPKHEDRIAKIAKRNKQVRA